MSITTGFFTGSNDLGTLFVLQNSSNNAIKSFTFNMSDNAAGYFWPQSSQTTLSFNTKGNYLLSLTSSSDESGNADLYTYYIAITTDDQEPSKYGSGTANSNLLFATPPIYANNSNKYNGIPISYTTIFNVTQTGNYSVFCYNYNSDNTITIKVNITTFFLN